MRADSCLACASARLKREFQFSISARMSPACNLISFVDQNAIHHTCGFGLNLDAVQRRYDSIAIDAERKWERDKENQHSGTGREDQHAATLFHRHEAPLACENRLKQPK